MFITTAGGVVGSAQIVDGQIIDADIAAAAAIALTKLSGLIGNPGTFLSVEYTSGTTHSLTTVANQRVVVIAKADHTNLGGGVATLDLKYNGVTKDQSRWQGGSGVAPVTLTAMYTEVPGAATQNITVEVGGSATASNQKILVIKIQQSA